MRINLIVKNSITSSHKICAIYLAEALRKKDVDAIISTGPKKGYINHAHVHTPNEVWSTRADVYTLYGPLGYDFNTLRLKLKLDPSRHLRRIHILLFKALVNKLPPVLRWPRLCRRNIVVTCEFLKNFLQEHFVTGEIKVIPPAVKPLKTWKTPKGKKILFVGKWFGERGELQILDVVSQVLSKHPDSEFIIVSGAYSIRKYKRKYERFVKALGIEKHVKFFGILGQKKIHKLFEECTLAVYPYLTYSATSVPMTLLEAIAHGKPVISTTFGAIPEIVKDGETGLLVEPWDQKLLARSMIRILSDPNLQKKLGDNALKGIKEKNCPEKVASAYLEIYKSLNYGRGFKDMIN